MNDTQSWLSWFLKGLLFLGFLLLVGRLFELQVIKGSYYRNLSSANRIRRVPITALRGKIYARGGEVLTGSDFAHVTGYLGEVTPDEVGKIDPNCTWRGPRKLGQLIGKAGLEKEYNCLLSGTDGEDLIEVNSKGEKIRELGKKEPIPGKDLHTNIDFFLQKKAAEAMQGKIGAVIATDTKGEVLVYYSSPGFDPANPSGSLNNSDLPFFDRVIAGTFHPGSVFKPVVALGALEQGVIDENYRFNDTGAISVKTLYGNYSYSNWYYTQYGRTEGEIGVVRAIARSTDTFFYKVGEMLGPDAIASWADKFGLGEKTNIDLPGEVAGLIPTPDWKEKIKGERWFLGNTYHMSIGQGDIAVTPIEINRYVAALASGKLCRPYLNSLLSPDCKDLKLDQKDLDLVKEGMVGVCSSGGTGYTFFDFIPRVACKTGTAEVGTDGEPHAWFILFAPYDNPEIAVTVLVERGGEGSSVAGPIARKIMDQWKLEKNP